MYIDTILHHHIRRCPYNIISIMIGLFQCFERVGGINCSIRWCNVWIGVVYGLGTTINN